MKPVTGVRSGWRQPRRLFFLRALFEADDQGIFLNEPFLRGLARDGEPEMDLVAGEIEARLESRHQLTLSQYYAPVRMWSYLVAPCFLAGLFANYLGPGGEVNLLLNPFVVLVFWNLLIFLWLVFPKGRQGGAFGRSPFLVKTLFLWQEWWYRKWTGHLEKTPKAAILARARLLFWRLWWRHYLAAVKGRISAVIHLAAAILVLGVIAGMYLRGLVQEYRFGWSSTFIRDAETLRGLLEILFAPALWLAKPLLPHGLPPVEGGGGPAWIHLFAFTALLYILFPRTVLAVVALRRARQVEQGSRPSLEDAGFRKMAALLRRQKTVVSLIDYGYTPPESHDTKLLSAVRLLFGGDLTPGPKLSLAWGETSLTLPASLEKGVAVWVVRFNGAQTPEEEVHRLFATELMSLAGKQEVKLLVVVDKSKVAAELDQGRRQLWREVLPAGCSFAWMDCDRMPADDMVEPLSDALSKGDEEPL